MCGNNLELKYVYALYEGIYKRSQKCFAILPSHIQTVSFLSQHITILLSNITFPRTFLHCMNCMIDWLNSIPRIFTSFWVYCQDLNNNKYIRNAILIYVHSNDRKSSLVIPGGTLTAAIRVGCLPNPFPKCSPISISRG